METFLQIALSLGIVLAAAAGSLWLLRRAGTPARGAGNVGLRVVAAAAVGPRERVVVVELGGTLLVVGVAPGRVQALHVLPRSGEGGAA